MKQPDLYYFETIKRRHKPSQILYGEYDPQASILCELITPPFLINTYSMKQPDLYYFETIKITSEA